ncbi:hypothetical protein [Streptomyces sp. NPDC001530]|uniref:hypothetical protein n=1 Tax=Streptomyces sp. NPDC001530 TaxID=3364582 RepID=UPI0036C5C071
MTDGEEFRRVLDVVLCDVRAQCSVRPDVRAAEDGYPGLMLYAPDGSGQGVYWGSDDRPGARLAEVADQVQEWAVEALWGEAKSAVWPHCPVHPDSHPLSATVVEGVAVWVCAKAPKGAAPVSRVGELPPRGVDA